MDVIYFATPEEFRQWLHEHHDSKDEQWVGFHKKATGIPSITWPESVDEALCYGWIDGLRRSVDDKSYAIRFTPRRPRSNWSAVNVSRVKELKKMGKMQPSGLKAFANRPEDSDGKKLQENHQLSAAFTRQIKADQQAWEFFEVLAPSIRRLSINWVMSAKKEETRQRRLNVLIDSCRNGEKIPLLTSSKKNKTKKR